MSKALTRLRLVADEDTHVIHDDFGNDGPYSGSYEHAIELKVKGLQLDGKGIAEDDYRPYPSGSDFAVDFNVEVDDYLYAVIVRYTDGDTFGSTSGNHVIAGIFKTEKEAKACEKEVRDPPKVGDYDHYKPWHGYFAGLDDVEIHNLRVRGG